MLTSKSNYIGNKKKIIDIEVFIIIVILIPFYRPYYLTTIQWLEIPHLCWLFFSGLAIITLYATKSKIVNFSYIFMLSFYGMLLYSTYKNDGMLESCLIHVVFIILMVILITSVYSYQKTWYSYLQATRFIVFTILITNVIIIILYPDGIPSISNYYQKYFLYGNNNGTIRSVIPGVMSSLILDSMDRKISRTSICLFGAIIFIAAKTIAATTFIALIFILIWMMLYKQLNRKASVVYFAVIGLVTIIEIVVVLLGNSLKVISFVALFFGKSSSFSGRTYLWTNILRSIHSAPIYGYGVEDLTDIAIKIGNSSGSHNFYLDTIYRSGFIGFSIFIAFLLLIGIKTFKMAEMEKNQYIMLGICCCYFLMWISEPFYDTEVFFIPIFCITYTALNEKKVKEIKETAIIRKNDKRLKLKRFKCIDMN